jgi:hypothetical protein
MDMIQVPFWDGNASHRFPNVKLRMDFRGPDIGDFVYHCHILGHEDNGMMAIIRVVPANSADKTVAPKAKAPAKGGKALSGLEDRPRPQPHRVSETKRSEP